MSIYTPPRRVKYSPAQKSRLIAGQTLYQPRVVSYRVAAARRYGFNALVPRMMPAAGYMRRAGFYGRFGPGIMNAEKKFFEDTQDVTAITSAGQIAFISLNRIPQGTTESTRVGGKCRIKSIHLRAQSIYAPPTAAAPNTAVRILLYLDKQCNGATATVAQIIETADEMAFNNLENSNRFNILMDKFYTHNTLSSTITAADVVVHYSTNKCFKYNHKCDIPLDFSSTTGAITEIKSNNVGILAIIGSASGLSLVITSRIRFTDI